ncbi:MAG: ABC transporter substrate-binding protein [Actinomycetota bacterium]|nr:ABC transporter substrate-binding protein [Actinomycetota bacterium]
MRTRRYPRRSYATVAVAGLLTGALAACGGGSSGGAGSGGGQASGGGGGGDRASTLVFGTSTDPVIIDGAYVSDGESIRAIRQLFETLVTTKEGGTDVEPLLAERWQASPDGRTYTFNLRSGVKFHDGEPFNAAAVCANFDRWYNFKGVQQSDAVAYYWRTIFGGFKNNEDPETPESLYSSCTPQGDTTAVIALSRPNSTFIPALTLPAFSIASPKALQQYGADQVGGTAESPSFTGTFGTEHPIGTGPFKLEKWERNNQLTMARNDDYWGKKASLSRLVFKPIADGNGRRQALESGGIDGYDLVAPADVDALRGNGFQILERPAFNIGYVGFNVKQKPVDDVRVRQAVAHAINREQLLQANYPPGAEVATQFQPPSLWGHNPDVPKYEYNPDKARQLLSEAGASNPSVEFWYPTDVSRPYMPDPVKNFEIIKADLEKVGFTVVPKAAKWDPDYLNAADTGKAGSMHLLGWTGDYGDPDNWSGVFFGRPKPQFGNFRNEKIQSALADALKETDQGKREAIYRQANADIMRELPAIPYVHTKPRIAFRTGVNGYVPSPVNNEDFSLVTVSGR